MLPSLQKWGQTLHVLVALSNWQTVQRRPAAAFRVPAGALPGEVRGGAVFSLSARSSTSIISSTIGITFDEVIFSTTFSCVKVWPCALNAAPSGRRLGTGIRTPL